MDTKKIDRLVIAGTNSGVGKTTLVAGLLAAYREKGLKAQPYKVGPDYIDPGFHKIASGQESYNLDTWLVPQDKLVPFFTDTANDCDIAIIEGVMGLYDGGREGVSSTAEIAKALKAPVVLVIDCKAMGTSAGAIAQGFKNFDPKLKFAGVLLNRLGSDNHERIVRDVMEELKIPVLGAVHRNEKMKAPERHLGLTPVTEADPTEALKVIKKVVQEEIDLEALLKVAQAADELEVFTRYDEVKEKEKVKIGVAFDEAFSFYYPASIHALEEEGAEIVYFSPLVDKELPSVDGVIFGGGFPEMFLSQLEKNKSMRKSIKDAASSGLPIYGECGGLMYLSERVADFVGNDYNMVGIVPANCSMQKNLQKVGYVSATASMDTLLTEKGDTLRGHEFHFSITEPTIDDFPWAFTFQGGRTNSIYKGGFSCKNILASYLHLNFLGNEKAAQRFVNFCREYSKHR